MTEVRVCHGRLVATPLLDPSQAFLGHTFNAPSYRIDPHKLEPGKGSLRHRPPASTSRSGGADRGCNSALPTNNAAAAHHLSEISTSQATAGVRLDVFIYQESDLDLLPNLLLEAGSALHLELNRRADEPVIRTLQRLGLNLQKKLQQQTKAPPQTKKQKKKKSAAVLDPVVWRHDDGVGQVAVDIAATMVNIDFCTMILSHNEPSLVELSLDGLSENGGAKQIMLTVEACPPTVTSVTTFADFDVRLFTGIPLTLTVETLYSTHSQVDWYVDSVVHQTTIQPNGLHSFVPDEEHIGKRLSVLVKALRTDEDAEKDLNVLQHDGSGSEHAFQFVGLIEPRPTTTILELRRPWLQEQERHVILLQQQRRQFRFLTYNILADQNAFSMIDGSPYYPYVSEEILDKRRRLPLVLHEIISYDADIVCLQEVDADVFDSLLLPTFQSLGYQGYYSGKVKNGTREGCATFWSLKIFLPTEKNDQHTYSIRDLVSIVDADTSDDGDRPESDEKIATLLRDSPELRHILTERLGHVFQLVPLRPRDVSAASTAPPVCWVVNTHLFYHPLASHIRLLQAYLLSRQVGKILHTQPGALIVTGDFNSSLRNAAAKLLMDRSVPENFRDIKDHLNRYKWEKGISGVVEEEERSPRDFPSVQLLDDFPILHSAIVPEPEFTHCVVGFMGSLDHILVSEQFQCVCYAPMPTKADVTTDVAMPSSGSPSDHVCLVCDFLMG
jgi:mRNA deadenylase 3'-5' endonuclease subunit Ccr4